MGWFVVTMVRNASRLRSCPKLKRSQVRGYDCLGNVKILSSFLFSLFGGYGHGQEIGEIGVMERPYGEADTIGDFKLSTDVLDDLGSGISVERGKDPDNQVVAVIGKVKRYSFSVAYHHR